MKVSTAVTKKIDKKILKQTLSDALVIAIKAGDFLRSKYGKFSQLDHKPDAGLVTEADKGSEALIKKALLLKYPSFDWLGEETGAQSQHKSDFRWVVDPLDGTTNFVHGFPFFCVSIG